MRPAQLTLALLLGTAGQAAFAQETLSQPDATEASAAAAGVPDEQDSGRLSVDVSLGFATSYYWRGIVQQVDQFLFQPGIELGVKLFSDDEITVGAVLGTWNSFGEPDAGAGDGYIGNWYENDLYASIIAESGRWAGDLTYTVYASPNDSFANVDEVSLGLSFDDSGLVLDDVSLAPSMRIAFELDGAADGENSGVYIEIGVAPSVSLGETGLGALGLTVPVTVGLSISNYYDDATGGDEVFGYLDVGADFSLDLPDPSGAGDLTASAGLHALFLGDSTEALNGDEDTELFLQAAISLSF